MFSEVTFYKHNKFLLKSHKMLNRSNRMCEFFTHTPCIKTILIYIKIAMWKVWYAVYIRSWFLIEVFFMEKISRHLTSTYVYQTLLEYFCSNKISTNIIPRRIGLSMIDICVEGVVPIFSIIYDFCKCISLLNISFLII